MAFRDFGYPEVREKFELTFIETNLFATVEPFPVSEDFANLMQGLTTMSFAVGTEKAKSEFIIAPILINLWDHFNRSFGMFSGVEFNVDASRGLNGFCDFLLTRSPTQSEVTRPVITIVEAKNDTIRSGYGQCVAAMVAAREFNANTPNSGIRSVYGVVTIGMSWKFLRLQGNELTLDSQEYLVSNLAKIMGILAHILAEPN